MIEARKEPLNYDDDGYPHIVDPGLGEGLLEELLADIEAAKEWGLDDVAL